MDWNALSAVADVVSTAVAILGIIFVSIQIIDFKKLLKATNDQISAANDQISAAKKQVRAISSAALYEQMIGIDRFFVENPEFKDYIYNGQEVGDDGPPYNSVRSLAEMMVDLMEHLLVQKDNLDEEVYKAWVKYFGNLYDESPIIREHFDRSGDWYANLRKEINRMGPSPGTARPNHKSGKASSSSHPTSQPT